MEKQGIWSEEQTITASMVDPFGRCRIDGLCNILQEVAGRHANARDLGFLHMGQRGLFWALSRLRLEMYQLPRWQDRIHLQTWVQGMRGPLSYRNFALHNDNNDLLASACSLWSAVDRQSRKPKAIPDHDFPILADKHPNCGKPNKLPAPARVDRETTYTVRYSDLDLVGHVNNVRYITWMIDTYGTYNQESRPSALEINYLGETSLGDSVLIQREGTPGMGAAPFPHRILHAGEDREIVRARLSWVKRDF